MRTDLYRDPKVCVMADLLIDSESQLSRYINQNMQRDMTITRNVMRNVTVGALVSVWGVLRHRGKRNEDDLIIKFCTISVIDDLSDIPGFGEAMQHVGWVVQTDESIIFPRFFEEFNVDPADELRAKNAERQRKYREKIKEKSNVISNVTVASQSNAREEKRRDIYTPPIPDNLLKDFLAVRKAKKVGPLTETAFNGIDREAKKAGITVIQAVEYCCKRGWAGFEASWLTKDETNKPRGLVL